MNAKIGRALFFWGYLGMCAGLLLMVAHAIRTHRGEGRIILRPTTTTTTTIMEWEAGRK